MAWKRTGWLWHWTTREGGDSWTVFGHTAPDATQTIVGVGQHTNVKNEYSVHVSSVTRPVTVQLFTGKPQKFNKK